MTKYDDADWHEGSALKSGLPRLNAFAHIGLYLGWLVRHDLVDPSYFRRDRLHKVRLGAESGTTLHGEVDDKLLSTYMTPDGAAFSAYYYEQYLSDFAEEFADRGDYRVPDDDMARARIDPVIDRHYRTWLDSGKPSPVTAQVELRPEEIARTSEKLRSLLGPLGLLPPDQEKDN